MKKNWFVPSCLLLTLAWPDTLFPAVSLHASWTAMAFCALWASCVIGYRLLHAPLPFRIKKADLFLAAYCLYMALSGSFSDAVHSPETACRAIILFLSYIAIRSTDIRYLPRLLFVFSISTLIRGVYSIHFELHDFLPGTRLYQIKGGFPTTSLWGGCLSIALTVHIGSGIFSTILRNNTFRQYLWYCGSLLFGILLFYADSRAAWVSSVAGIGMLFYIRYRHTFRILFRKHRAFSIGILLLFLYVGALFLYRHKPDSAQGHLQIHRITCDMLKARPWSGFGTGGFTRHYMDYQAAYFETHPDQPGIRLADETIFAFNEYLKLFSEQGLIRGLAIIGIFLFIAMRSPRKKPSYYPSNAAAHCWR